MGYQFFLGGSRHFGYYDRGTKWPFPLKPALRRMEDHLFHSLHLQPSARVLDAGCGDGRVAIQLAGQGAQVYGIDIVANHVKSARTNVRANGLENAVNIDLMDYHYLDDFADSSFDGVFTMESFGHTRSPERALEEFFRVLKPGGSIAIYDYEHQGTINQNNERNLIQAVEQIKSKVSMPAHSTFLCGGLERTLVQQGFQSIEIKDLSENIKPLLRLFFLKEYLPYFFPCLLGLQTHLINTQVGVFEYRIPSRQLLTYIAITAKKPY